ncbi:FAD-dependent oxidoreductase [uncultured Algimonas sp.]|uniref:FAD-dependent oxidoreductase n=1 Tax=uncultured Algimonas sp. TaxID=1547920 RepID=UPI0026251A56|nr:FAD-dependent oxidoreductase [uncultured Algimonas sp.]
MSDKPPADINYTFSDAELEALKPYGTVRSHAKGEMLVPEGRNQADMLVTLSGETHIFIETPDGPRRVGWMELGQFSGDIGVMTGQTTLAYTIMGEAGDVLHIAYPDFQRLLVENSRLSDIFITTLTARRAFARDNHSAVVVIGAAQDRLVFAARDLLSKFGVPHLWLSPDRDPVAKTIMDARDIALGDLPVVLRGRSQVLVKPTAEEIASSFGFDLLPDGEKADVLVIGAGPAGLAACVYAASEGLDVVAIDAHNPGGQAGTSSKIENYLGFPSGVSGQELTERAMTQAMKFGARLAAPVKATGLERHDDHYCLSLSDGRRIGGRSVVIATGAQYRRLPIRDLERYEGRGIYYGATPMEAQLCKGSEIAIVGAGNSAGQGAVFLSQTCEHVHMLYRRADIRETMSEYLVRRLEETPNITLHPQTEIAALHGLETDDIDTDRLTGISVRRRDAGDIVPLDTPFVFLFVGARPFTDWLPDSIACDRSGFVQTGARISDAVLADARWDLDRRPTDFETSWPRIYAVGDVQAGSVKRVASAVGQGSVVVSAIHAALGETAS